MTSETDALKTNEFLRRRKLRLQQVREQSKDIAKKIRQRAKVETLRQVVDLDSKKQKEYFDRQDKLVRRLEVLYARGLNNVGASHQSATEETRREGVNKTDLSKVRGIEAAAELRKKRQEKLDEQKKLLDRKLQARETANELSRDKSSLVANKLSQKITATAAALDVTNEPVGNNQGGSAANVLTDNNKGADSKNEEVVTKNDMSTQWDVKAMPNEWEPTVPTLTLPRDDQGSLKEHDNVPNTSDRSKRLDLFAISNEMPSDLRGSQVEPSVSRDRTMPSLTLVSEYLQSRKLRLRETEVANTKRPSEDMQGLKQTIQQTRTNKAKGSSVNMCHVLDEQVIPVPSWHAERTCEFCTHTVTKQKSCIRPRQFTSVTNDEINIIYSSIRPVKLSGVSPKPLLQSSSPFERNKVCYGSIAGKHTTHLAKTKAENVLNRKSSVQMYNHNTRDTRDLPCSDEQLVVRDLQSEEDAYSQALKESSVVTSLNIEHTKKVQEMRNKVAVSKQTVEKEYRDTINFLNSLPKDKGNKVTKTAYMDDRRQQIQKDNRQHKMQQEFRKIEKECNRHHSCMDKSRSKSRSPTKRNADDFTTKDFEYSWMPVPESDGNLAIHTIPNSVKSGKSNNNVKFSKVDSYHEYRSRHKHTPPTKETAYGKHSNKQRIVIDKGSSNSTDDSSISSDTSSVENLNLTKKPENNQNLSDAERIIIYKILDSKSRKNAKKKNKYLSDIAKSLTSIEKSTVVDNQSEKVGMEQSKGKAKTVNKATDNTVSFEQINEGVYRVAGQKGGDNIASMHFSKDPLAADTNEAEQHHAHQNQREEQDIVTGNTSLQWDIGDDHSSTRNLSCHCPPTCKHKKTAPATTNQPTAATTTHQPTATTSTTTSSFKTAPTETSPNPQDGCVKFVDEDGQETGKFFLGAAGLLKDNAYEVVIQLRKKDGTKHKSFSATELPKQSNQFSKNNDKVQSETVENNNLNPSTLEKSVQIQLNSENEIHESKRPMEDTKQPTPLITVEDRNIQQSTEESDPSSELLTKSSEEKYNVPDKTTFCQVAYQIPVSHFDPPSRPPTTTYSAYTQTTNSPDSRPVYLHMSSSASTAYMSPPERILPKYMRGTSTMTEYETCAQSINVDDNKNNKKCKHARKITNKRPTSCKRKEPKIQIAPPNSTARLRQTTYDDFEDQDLMAACKVTRIDKTKCGCRNCGTRVPSKHRIKQQSHKNKHPSVKISHQGPHSKLPGRTGVGYHKNNAGANLNPTVKGYVNKLLALNREGLKAMEVADQECSSVGTPGSSIVNVPYNIDDRKPFIANKISIEHIKQTLIQQIIDEHIKQRLNCTNNSNMYSQTLRNTRKKPVHKVKSLNISKNLLKNQMNMKPKLPCRTKRMNTLSSLTTDDSHKTSSSIVRNSRSHSSPSTRSSRSPKLINSDNVEKSTAIPTHIINKDKTSKVVISSPRKKSSKINQSTHHQLPPSRATNTDTSQESRSTHDSNAYYKHKPQIPMSMSTQTGQNIDNEFMKLAEDKLQNMEKIADLTEKCTKRLSNLAKVLEEVRKNKSLAYSQISTDSTDSHSDHKSDKIVKSPVPTDEPNRKDITETIPSTEPDRAEKGYKLVGEKDKLHPDYMPFLANISQPAAVFQLSEPKETSRHIQVSLDDTDTSSSINTKLRTKPPPALSRVHLKHCSDYIMPHELSTVLEVDSPMSVKNKNLSSRNDAPNSSNRSSNEDKEQLKDSDKKDPMMNPDLLQSNPKVSKHIIASTESSDDSKFQMIDIKHFNEIMLEPFISINEYAKKYNVEPPDEGSNMEDLHKEDAANDEISSLHSDGSLPDVIAELLKRKIITEPFKFDSPSNINSTMSSESTLSILALSKARRQKKRSSVMFYNKENIGETSDSMSISSNPDLENAFKMLGLGWASSTLKKTKERLALSSSSNTSSSSLSQFKIKSFNQEIPALVTDSVSSALLSKKKPKGKNSVDNVKNVQQQTNLSNSMTVKEFLINELADKITFNNKDDMNETEEEFVSLYETKMPEGLKQQSVVNRENHSVNDSIRSGANRARTSTPVQIFKSSAYHSSSSSNVSNGLFSNADDLSSVKMTSNSMKNHSTSDKDDLTIPNFSLKMKKGSDCSKSD